MEINELNTNDYSFESLSSKIDDRANWKERNVSIARNTELLLPKLKPLMSRAETHGRVGYDQERGGYVEIEAKVTFEPSRPKETEKKLGIF